MLPTLTLLAQLKNKKADAVNFFTTSAAIQINSGVPPLSRRHSPVTG
jgi:hypothetical protein